MTRIPRVARQTSFLLFPILIIPVLGMESPQRVPRPPPTLPTTQAGPDSTHDELAYHLPILRMYAIQISPELRHMRHPTLYQHHPYMPALTSYMDAHPGMPYHDPLSEKHKDSKMSHPLYTQLHHFAVFVSKFYFRPNFTH